MAEVVRGAIEVQNEIIFQELPALKLQTNDLGGGKRDRRDSKDSKDSDEEHQMRKTLRDRERDLEERE